MVVTCAPSQDDGERRAGLDRLAVDVDDAGAALRGVAADMGAGEAQVFAQELDQQRARIDIGGNGLAVDRHRNLNHSKIPPNRLSPPPPQRLRSAKRDELASRAEARVLLAAGCLPAPSAGRQQEKGADMLAEHSDQRCSRDAASSRFHADASRWSGGGAARLGRRLSRRARLDKA